MLGLHVFFLRMHDISTVKLQYLSYRAGFVALKLFLTGEICHILDLQGCRQYNKEEQHPDRLFSGSGYFLLEGANVLLIGHF